MEIRKSLPEASRCETICRRRYKISARNLDFCVTPIFAQSAFDPVGSEFELWTPTDYVANPKFLDSIIDPLYKQLASDVHSIWSQLGRKMKQDVKVYLYLIPF